MIDQTLAWLDSFRLSGFTGLDLAVMVIVAVSALIAYVRGIVHETVTLAVWVGAVVAAYFSWPIVHEFLTGRIADPLVLVGASVAIAFIVPLIVFKIVGYLMSKWIEDSPLAVLDRYLGLVFGLARGALLAVAVYVALLFAFGTAKTPSWIEEARLRPQLNEGYAWLREQVPQLPDPAAAPAELGEPAATDG